MLRSNKFTKKYILQILGAEAEVEGAPELSVIGVGKEESAVEALGRRPK